MSVGMAFSTERVLLAWVDDLELGLQELSRGERRPQQNALLQDLLQSAHGLLELSETELRKLAGVDIALLDQATGGIQSVDDIRRLCSRIRRVLRADAGDVRGESTD